MEAQPAFALDFDPTFLLSEGSVDHDFDKILDDLDLELATDNASNVVSSTVGIQPSNAPSERESDAAGLRELFGLQQAWQLQPEQAVVQQQQQQQRQQLSLNGQLQQQQLQQPQQLQQQQLEQQQEQLHQQFLLQQFPQQQQAHQQAVQQQHQQQQQVQQQAQQQVSMAYQLPSSFMQPVQGLPGALDLQGISMYPAMQLLQPGTYPQQLQQEKQQAPQLFTAAMQQPGPFFTFTSLPGVPAALSQLSQGAAAAGMFTVPASIPAAWPYMPPGMAISPVAAVAVTSSSNGQPVLSHQDSPNSFIGTLPGQQPVTAVMSAPRNGRGRSKNNAAPAAPGAEKPKGPSQRFRERQKQTISSLEQEVTQKLAQLQALSAENEVLKLRSAVLEAVTSGREYHMRVIQEHGPPKFEMSVDSSPRSNSNSLAGISSAKSFGSDSVAAAAVAAGTAAAAAAVAAATCEGGFAVSSGSPRLSGSLGSCCTGAASSGAGADAASSPGLAAATSDAATAAAEAAASDAATAVAAVVEMCPDPLRCGDPEGVCSPEQQRCSITCIKQMTAADIVTNWKQFLQDVSGELLAADDDADQRRLAHGNLGGLCNLQTLLRQQQQHDSLLQQDVGDDGEEDSHESGSVAFTMSKVCRWCGCTNSEEHAAQHCQESAAQQQQQQQQHLAAAAAVSKEDVVAAATDERLGALVSKYSYMTKFVALLNPGVLYSLFGRNLDTGEPAVYTDEHWRTVVSRLRLTKHQKAHIMACAELYFSSLTGIIKEREALQDALTKADAALSECQKRLLGVDGTLNQLQLLDRLSSNLKKEHVLRIMLNCFVWGRILTAVQFAKTAVYSHPFFPDVHAMVCVMYEDARAVCPECKEGLVFPHRVQAANAAALCKAEPVDMTA